MCVLLSCFFSFLLYNFDHSVLITATLYSGGCKKTWWATGDWRDHCGTTNASWGSDPYYMFLSLPCWSRFFQHAGLFLYSSQHQFFYLLVIHFNWFLKMYFLKCVLKDPPGFFPRILGHEAIGWVSTFCILVIAVMIIICQNFCTHSQHHVQDCNVNCGFCQLQMHHVTLSAI
jgi:hypothetical protein